MRDTICGWPERLIFGPQEFKCWIEVYGVSNVANVLPVDKYLFLQPVQPQV